MIRTTINNTTQVKKDLTGGMLAAIIGLPMGLAFGVQSGLGAQAGLYTAIIIAVVAALIGGTRTLISDPTGPMTVVAATVVTLGITHTGDAATALPLILGTFVLAGIFELIFGVLDFGRYVKFMPYPVVSSFMAGIGVIIISMQIFPLMGLSSPKGFVNIFANLGDAVSNLNPASLALGLLTIAIIYLLPMISKRIPAILAALVVCTLISIGLNLNLPIIGSIPRSLPSFHLAEITALQWVDLRTMITPAIMLGGLGVIDSLLTSVVADNLTNTKHDSRKTVIGQGLGNIVVGLFGGIPGAGATMGTVTNIKGGGTSRFSGFMKGVFMLIIILGVADYVEMIPMAVLAGILISIGISIIDFKGIRMLTKAPKQDVAVWAIVLLFTVFDNLLNAVAVGFTLASVLFIGRVAKNMSKTQITRSLADMVDKQLIPAELTKSIYVQHLDGPLFFGFANQYRDFCKSLKDMLIVIIRMENVTFVDQSGMVTLDSVVRDWHDRGIQVYITGANPEVLQSLKDIDLIPQVLQEDKCFQSFEQCVTFIKKSVEGESEQAAFEFALLDSKVLETREKRVA